MWIFLNDAFLSIVAPTPGSIAAKANRLVVRARAKGDIERVFPSARLSQARDTDYAFRAVVNREDVAEALAEQARELNYTNFKDSVEEPDRQLHYTRAWAVMLDFQDARGHGGKYNDDTVLWSPKPKATKVNHRRAPKSS